VRPTLKMRDRHALCCTPLAIVVAIAQTANACRPDVVSSRKTSTHVSKPMTMSPDSCGIVSG
jgi:hypothetical protein